MTWICKHDILAMKGVTTGAWGQYTVPFITILFEAVRAEPSSPSLPPLLECWCSLGRRAEECVRAMCQIPRLWESAALCWTPPPPPPSLSLLFPWATLQASTLLRSSAAPVCVRLPHSTQEVSWARLPAELRLERPLPADSFYANTKQFTRHTHGNTHRRHPPLLDRNSQDTQQGRRLLFLSLLLYIYHYITFLSLWLCKHWHLLRLCTLLSSLPGSSAALGISLKPANKKDICNKEVFGVNEWLSLALKDVLEHERNCTLAIVVSLLWHFPQ